MDGTRQGLPSCHVRNIEVRGMVPWDADKPAEMSPGRLKVLHLLGPTRPNWQAGDGKAKHRLRLNVSASARPRCDSSPRLGISGLQSLLVNGRNGSELAAIQSLSMMCDSGTSLCQRQCCLVCLAGGSVVTRETRQRMPVEATRHASHPNRH